MINAQKQTKTRSDLVKIYILHGWTYSVNKWLPLTSILENKELDPILLKIPGLTTKIDKPWTIDDYVNWFNNKLENEKNPINILGHSNGGRIAIAFALKHPDKIKNLILIDSAGIYHNEFSIALKRSVFKIIAKAGKKILNNGSARKLLYKMVGEGDYENANKNMKKTMINLLGADKYLKIENITTPTTIIWGEKDKITPLSDGKVLNQKIIGSKLFIINNTRHSPQFTRPKDTAEIILKEL